MTVAIISLCDDFSSNFNSTDWTFHGNGMHSGYGHSFRTKAAGYGIGLPYQMGHYMNTWVWFSPWDYLCAPLTYKDGR